ncbi:MAG: tRNA 2-thiocytidine biosynthesis TtcA family protein [Halanaerobiales bacterium]|nr:tRNA 2-thiocytidine biosynthesis TtcA family protein [Halanaerobiales bacterium]
MQLTLPKKYTSKIVQAIGEFNLIAEGDHILVGLSGGKDSSFLLYALAVLKKHLALNFTISALTIDLGFAGTDYSQLQAYCRQLGIPYHIEKTQIAEYILSEQNDNPCAKCALFRKGAMVEYMKKAGWKKIAYGHHYDDAVVTYLMSIIYSGQLVTFQPKQYLSQNDIYIIRPLVYLREHLLGESSDLIDFQPMLSPCPYDQKSKRTEIKQYLQGFTAQKQVFYNLAAAMRQGVTIDLWPEEVPHRELAQKIKKLWSERS